MPRFALVLLCCMLLFPAGFALAAEDTRPPIMVEGKSSLPLRVLTRPMSSLYQSADENSAVLQGNLPAFSNFYVYTKPQGEGGQPWYEVGQDDKGTVSGWLRADDVFEWKQTMCLAYTSPADRKPVLMFENRKPLDDLLKMSAEERAAGVNKLYETIESRNIPANFPVLSVEPKLEVDISKQFYLLPILNFQAIEIDNRPGRILELAAVTASGPKARDDTDIRKPENKDFVIGATTSKKEALQQTGENLAVDIVWVIDTTLSMGPYIDKVTELVRDASNRIIAANPEFDQRLRFGIWGYRDPADKIPNIEYLTHNYTPELQPISDFLNTMGTVKETRIDSIDDPEDVFSGINDAMLQTAWRPGSLKIMILVGDASSHEMGHEWNYSGKNAETLRTELNEHGISLFAVQVRPKRGQRDQRLAQEQFTTLAWNKDQENAAYIDVNAGQEEDFSRAAEIIILPAVRLISEALTITQTTARSDETVQVITPEASPTPQTSSTSPALLAEMDLLRRDMLKLEQDIGSLPTTEKEKEFISTVNNSLNAAMVDWLGSATEAQAPRDIVAWAVDKDLLDSNKASLEVRLLINKRQLDSLRTLLGEVIEAGRRSSISGDDFFTSLQAASSIVVRDPDKLSQAANLEKSGLIPEFLDGLPYQSRLMSMNNELWASLSPDDQDNFVNKLEANVKTYQSIHDKSEGWIALNEGDEADEMVYPLPLELLP